ncbi:Uncharacterized protein DBV15_08125 [Temnothorax longispinosus]|uniref:Uncharacterized protein n=1 Tax=Temnothorax longispinosus TaxID=300112 RepID=A0A4S2KH95_9HYME|nr:Uncharacterized protein DBV15_08125 [Temnothorax longispinosus]
MTRMTLEIIVFSGCACRIFPNAQHLGVVHAKSTRSFQVLHEFRTCTKVYSFTSYVIGIKASSGEEVEATWN